MRDLQKDLELCEKATPGPWEWKKHDYYEELVNLYGTTVMDDGSACGEYAAQINSNTSDGKFIAAARSGWPEAIQRAMAAETRVEELETALKIMEKQLEIAAREITNVNSEFDTCPSEYDKELTCTCNGTIADVYRCWLERWKQKALAELEGDKLNELAKKINEMPIKQFEEDLRKAGIEKCPDVEEAE